MIAAPSAAPLVRAVAAEAYSHGARFFDPWWFDPDLKRIRAELAAEDSLQVVPPWHRESRDRPGGVRRAADAARGGPRRPHLDRAQHAAGADGRNRPEPRRPRPAAGGQG